MINKIKQHKKEIQFIIKCLLIMGLICLCLYQPMMKIFENPQLLRNQLQSFGLFGQIIFVGIVILQVIFVFLPGEIVEIMAGFIYGPFVGLLLCLIGSAMGSLLIYTFVKKWGQTSFHKRPIGEVDSLILSALTYLKWDDIAPSFELNLWPSDIVILLTPSILVHAC